MNTAQMISIGCGLFAMGCGIAFLLIADRKRDLKKLRDMSDAGLIVYGLWDECDGEPMNEYAEEYERRHGFTSQNWSGKDGGPK